MTVLYFLMTVISNTLSLSDRATPSKDDARKNTILALLYSKARPIHSPRHPQLANS